MNRIRAWYVQQAPDLDKYFMMGTTDDMAGIYKPMGGIRIRSLAADVISPTRSSSQCSTRGLRRNRRAGRCAARARSNAAR